MYGMWQTRHQTAVQASQDLLVSTHIPNKATRGDYGSIGESLPRGQIHMHPGPRKRRSFPRRLVGSTSAESRADNGKAFALIKYKLMIRGL
jgi:hypothetical protein